MTATTAESAWQDIASAPKDRLIALYGILGPLKSQRHLYGDLSKPMRALGYWDPIDGAWSLAGSTWLGPWILATHWQEAPAAPDTCGRTRCDCTDHHWNTTPDDTIPVEPEAGPVSKRLLADPAPISKHGEQ